MLEVVKTVFIYALKDPTTDEVRYVGKAQDVKKRFAAHLSDRGRNHRTNWIGSLRSGGFLPHLEIVDEVPEVEWPMLEAAYIQFYQDAGCRLVNSSPGGEGVTMTPETREKIRVARRRQTYSEETCARISASNTGKTRSLETRAKISAAHRGKTLSLETRAKLSAACKERTFSEETCAKISASNTGKRHSPETRAKIGDANRKRVVTPETRAKMSVARLGKGLSEETKLKLSEAGKTAWKAGKFSARRPRRNRGA